MADVDVVIVTELELIAPLVESGSPDWDDVTRRASRASASKPFRTTTTPHQRGSARPSAAAAMRRRKRILTISAVAAVAILVPLVAVAASQKWWFLAAGAPQPTSAPTVVAKRVWAGKQWDLVAYPSGSSICVGVTPAVGSYGAGMNCASFVTDGRPSPKRRGQLTITFLLAGPKPAYIAGPVISAATRVMVVLADGRHLMLPTFAAPSPLTHVRFYLRRLRPQRVEMHPRIAPPVRKLVGINKHGDVVACLDVLTNSSNLSACR